jgi:hypothetical protein
LHDKRLKSKNIKCSENYRGAGDMKMTTILSSKGNVPEGVMSEDMH